MYACVCVLKIFLPHHMGSQMPSSEQLSVCFSHRWILFGMVLQKMRNLVHAHPQMAPSPCSSTHRQTSVHAQPHPTNFFFSQSFMGVPFGSWKFQELSELKDSGDTGIVHVCLVKPCILICNTVQHYCLCGREKKKMVAVIKTKHNILYIKYYLGCCK